MSVMRMPVFRRLAVGWVFSNLGEPQTIGTAIGAALIAIVDYRILVIAMGVVIAACAAPVAARRSASPPSAEHGDAIATGVIDTTP